MYFIVRLFYALLLPFLMFLCAAEPSSDTVLVDENSPKEDSVQNLEKQAAVQHEITQPFKLIPHKAEYEVVYSKEKSKNQEIQNVSGTSTIEIIKTKQGWSYKQHLSIQATSTDGSTTTLEKDVASWESPSEMSFRVEDFRNGSLESTFQGSAEYSDDLGWQVTFEEPETDGFISKRLTFPIGQLENILLAIGHGKKIISDQVVFDSCCGVKEPVKINTIITNSKNNEIMINNRKYQTWKIQHAVYDFKSVNALPDYAENQQEITSNGVISSMETCWGDGICVTLKLKSLTIYK